MLRKLEPIMLNINHQSSYEEILSVIQEIEDKYWSSAVGPAAGDVFKKFSAVRQFTMLTLQF